MIKATASGLTVNRSPYLRIDYSRGSVFNVADIHIADTLSQVWGVFKTGSDITVEYDDFIGGAAGQFTGFIQNIYAVNKDTIGVICVSDGVKLAETFIKESYNGETSAGIVKRLAQAAGFSVGKLDIPDVTIPHIIFDNTTIYQAINQIYRTLEKLGNDMTDKEYWVEGGQFYAGDFSAEGSKPNIETKKNLIAHSYAGKGFPRLTTPLIAGFKHSQDFKLNDTRRGISEIFRATEVTHIINEGKARTHIGYKYGF